MSDSLPPLPPETPAPAVTSEVPSAQRSWAIAIHLSALLSLLGFTNLLGPLVIWLLKRSESAYLDGVGKRVLNFQISWFIYFVVAIAVTFVLTFVLIGFLLIPVLAIAGIVWVVFTIIGAVKESNGETYAFPLSIQFLK